jgi:hypothetical protein
MKFTQIRQNIWKVQMEICLSPYEKYGYHFHEHRHHSGSFCGRLLHQNHKLGKNIQIYTKFNLHPKHAFCRAYFHRIHVYSTTFCKDLYTKLHDNPSNSLVTDTRSHTDEHGVSTQDILLYTY